MKTSHEDRRGTIVHRTLRFDTGDVFATAAENRFDGAQIQRGGQVIGAIKGGVIEWTPEEFQQRRERAASSKADLRTRLAAFCDWLDKGSSWEDGRPRMLPNGTSALDGSNSSRLIVGAFEGAILQNAGGNAEASDAARGTGHDFAVVPLGVLGKTQFIVDWNASYNHPDAPCILDLDDPGERKLIEARYGDPGAWGIGEHETDSPCWNRAMVMHLRDGELPSRVSCFDPAKFVTVAYVRTDDLDVAVELTTHHAPLIGGAKWTDKVDSRVEPRGGAGLEHRSSFPGRTVVQSGGTHYLYGEDLSWTPIPAFQVVRHQREQAARGKNPYLLPSEGPSEGGPVTQHGP